MLRERSWRLNSPLPVDEIAQRIGDLFDRGTDFTRNLHIPREYPKSLTESGFTFAVTPAWGGHATLLHCSGTFEAAGAETTIEVRFRLATSAWLIPVGVGLFFWTILVVALYPVSIVLAFASLAGLACVVTTLIGAMAWYAFRSCRKGIDELLSVQLAPQVQTEPGPKYPWWELLGAGLFSLLAATFTWWYLSGLERGPPGQQLRLPTIAARLYAWGGKWPIVLVLAISGTAFTVAGLRKLFRKSSY